MPDFSIDVFNNRVVAKKGNVRTEAVFPSNAEAARYAAELQEDHEADLAKRAELAERYSGQVPKAAVSPAPTKLDPVEVEPGGFDPETNRISFTLRNPNSVDAEVYRNIGGREGSTTLSPGREMATAYKAEPGDIVELWQVHANDVHDVLFSGAIPEAEDQDGEEE